MPSSSLCGSSAAGPRCATIETPAGSFQAHYSNHGLTRLEFPVGSARRTAPSRNLELPPPQRAWHELVTTALRQALAGASPAVLPPLDLSGGTPFQQKVWAALRQIPCCQTRSYRQIAAAIGQPGAARAVGAACGANPVPVFVPCHRVLASNGGLGGFSGGLKWKRWLLAREGRQI